jgi:hypothetical protein
MALPANHWSIAASDMRLAGASISFPKTLQSDPSYA